MSTARRCVPSRGHKSGADLRPEGEYTDQNACHRPPNEILVSAYNTTTDFRIKNDIVAFNYSKDNIISSTHNKQHSVVEASMKANKRDNAATNKKGEQMCTALMKMFDEPDD